MRTNPIITTQTREETMNDEESWRNVPSPTISTIAGVTWRSTKTGTKTTRIRVMIMPAENDASPLDILPMSTCMTGAHYYRYL